MAFGLNFSMPKTHHFLKIPCYLAVPVPKALLWEKQFPVSTPH